MTDVNSTNRWSAAAALMLLAGSVCGCSTVEGVGDDVEAAGDAIEEAADEATD